MHPNDMEKYISFSLIENKKIKNKKTENKKIKNKKIKNKTTENKKIDNKKTKNKKVKSQSFRQELRFIDSAQFVLSSLDKLVGTTPNENLEITAMYETDPEKRALLLRKGVSLRIC